MGEIGFEPTWVSPRHFKCLVYTNSTTRPPPDLSQLSRPDANYRRNNNKYAHIASETEEGSDQRCGNVIAYTREKKISSRMVRGW